VTFRTPLEHDLRDDRSLLGGLAEAFDRTG
jgi:hypothetical protein